MFDLSWMGIGGNTYPAPSSTTALLIKDASAPRENKY